MKNMIRITSSVGVGSLDMGMLTLGDFSKGHRSSRPKLIEWGTNSRYLVGENVAEFTRPMERLDFLRLAEGPELCALTYAALGLLLGEGSHTISMMTGLPVEVLEDEKLAQKTKRTLRDWLEGIHRFRLDGKDFVLTIERVASMAQPAGTFFAWGLNDQGQWINSAEAFQSMVAICDIGFNTLDVFTVKSGQIVRRYTGGDTTGIRRAVEQIISVLRERYSVEYSLFEADFLLRTNNPTIHIAAGRIDLNDLIIEAKQAAAGAINTFLEARWGNGQQFGNTIFTGGGAELLGALITSQYPLGYLMPHAAMANAIGLARYGRRVFDTEIVVGLDPGFGGFKAVQV